MKPRNAIIVILAALSVSLALAEDFKTVNGKEYKNATVSRVEPDGIVIRFSGGIVKIRFTELPKGGEKGGQSLLSTLHGSGRLHVQAKLSA